MFFSSVSNQRHVESKKRTTSSGPGGSLPDEPSIRSRSSVPMPASVPKRMRSWYFKKKARIRAASWRASTRPISGTRAAVSM